MSQKTPAPLFGRLLPDRFYRRAEVVENCLLGYRSTRAKRENCFG